MGEIEKLPVDNDSIDVAISNCVINLVPNKKKAYSEIYRVLKTDGKFVISDIVTSGKLPDGLRKSVELYVGWVAGALTKDEYLGISQSAGFKEVSILEEKEYSLPDSYILQYLNKDQLKDFKDSGAKILSLTVKGVK